MIAIQVIDDPKPLTKTQEVCLRNMMVHMVKEKGHIGRSASGKSLALAVDYCEQVKLPYTIHAVPGAGYTLQTEANAREKKLERWLNEALALIAVEARDHSDGRKYDDRE